MNNQQATTWKLLYPLLFAFAAWLYGYATLKSDVLVTEQNIEKILTFQSSYSKDMNRLSALEYQIKTNALDNNKFLSRFDAFLLTQERINEQLVTLTIRQEYILKKIEKE